MYSSFLVILRIWILTSMIASNRHYHEIFCEIIFGIRIIFFKLIVTVNSWAISSNSFFWANNFFNTRIDKLILPPCNAQLKDFPLKKNKPNYYNFMHPTLFLPYKESLSMLWKYCSTQDKCKIKPQFCSNIKKLILYVKHGKRSVGYIAHLSNSSHYWKENLSIVFGVSNTKYLANLVEYICFYKNS